MEKRKRVVVTIDDKLKAIRRLDAGETIKSVARSYGVGEVTVGDWKRNRAKIEEWCINQASSSTGRKSMKLGGYEQVNEILFTWFNQQRLKGVPLSGPMLQQKAILISKQFPDLDQFTASSGWLERWKKRYGVRQLTVCREKLSADTSSIEKFRQDFKKQIEDSGYTRDQIYNCDESGLNYKMLPSKTLASQQEKSAPGHKRSKERVTIMACSNASGRHKIPLMVIGKSKRPRALKDISPKALPVYYKSQKSAWMDANLFTIWFTEEFVPSVTKFLKRKGLPIKAILLMDNAPSHPGEGLHVGEIIVKFFPPNVTSIMQPKDQGVLENIKKKYRSLFLVHLLQHTEKEDLTSGLRKITLKDVIYWVSQAWDSVRDSTIQKSWSKVIDFEKFDDSEDDIPLDKLASKLKNRKEMLSCSVSEEEEEKEEDEKSLFELMQTLEGCENVTEEDVEQWVAEDDLEKEFSIEELSAAFQDTQKPDYDDADDEDMDECVVDDQRVSHQEGFAALDKALLYVEQQAEATPGDLLYFKRWKDMAARKRKSNFTQKRIDSYFPVL